MQVTEPTPAGWYPDPQNSGQQRYWDGNTWTQQFAPAGPAAAPTAAAVKKPFYKRTWFIVVAVLVGLGVVSNLIGGSPSTTSESEPPAAEKAAAPEKIEAPAEIKAEPEVVTPEPVAEPAKPDLTMGQKQAVGKGESYLDMAGFSRTGLIDQLVFEGFSTEDATFAVDYIAPDWNREAAEKAQSYIDMTSFSRQGLIDQLLFEGFSQAEAEYGVTAVGY